VDNPAFLIYIFPAVESTSNGLTFIPGQFLTIKILATQTCSLPLSREIKNKSNYEKKASALYFPLSRPVLIHSLLLILGVVLVGLSRGKKR
jgi:hypothetical protein